MPTFSACLSRPLETHLKRLILAATTIASLVTTLPAVAQVFAKPEDAVRYRVGAFVVMQNHLGRIGAMVKGNAPFDGAVASANADIVEMMSRLPYQAFVEGTAGKGDKDSAKPNIWTERPKFDAAAKALQGETSKLAAAAKLNNLEALKTAYGATTKACKACHDDFRQR